MYHAWNTFGDDLCGPGAGFRHFCQPKVDAVSQNGGQQQSSVFWSDVIILRVREVTRKSRPAINFFQYLRNFRMGKHAIDQTCKGRNT